MEYVGREPEKIFNAIHTRSSYGATINTRTTDAPNVEDDFHVFAIEWDRDAIQFYYDENQVYRYSVAAKSPDTWPFDKPFFLILNLALGGNFGGVLDPNLSFPVDYIIDYVRVYQ
jgi:beta-glucanase (GH16 family)